MIVSIRNLTSSFLSTTVGGLTPGQSLTVNVSPEQAHEIATQMKDLSDAGRITITVSEDPGKLDSLEPATVQVLADEGSNSGDVTLGTFGSTPSAKGASISGQILTLQPADATHPGLLSIGTQTVAGAKTLSGTLSSSVASGSVAVSLLTGAKLALDTSNTTYLSSDATTITTTGAFTVTNAITSNIAAPAKGAFTAKVSAGNYVLYNDASNNPWGLWTNSTNNIMNFTVGNVTQLSLDSNATQAGFTYKILTPSINTNGPGISGGGTGPTLLGSRHIAGYGALWLGVAIPSATNYAISTGPSGDTTLNSTSGQQLGFGLSNGVVAYFDSTKLSNSLKYDSTVASGSDAYSALTGARWHVGGGLNDYFSSDGSTISFAAPVAITQLSTSISATINNNTLSLAGAIGTIYYSAGNATTGRIYSHMSAANCTATNPAVCVTTDVALDATDALFGVKQQNEGTNVFLVDYSGACTASSLTLTSSATTGLTLNAGGAVNWNLVRNSTSLELNVNGDAYQKWDYNSGTSTLKYGLNVGLGGSSTNLVQVFGACDLQSTTVGNIGAGEDTLMTYQLPASALVVSNRALVWEASGTVANNANAKTITLYYGTATLMAVTVPVSTPGDWIARTTIIRTAGNAQKFWTRLEISNSTTHLVSGVFVAQGTTSQTDAGAHNIYITATATSDNDVTQTVNTIVML